MKSLLEQQKDTREFLVTSLRRWSTVGWDNKRGVFLEGLDFDANPLFDRPRRGRVQARQTLVFALAHLRGLDPDGAYLRLAADASCRSRDTYGSPEGGWYFAADAAGRVTDPHCYAYEQSFLIMSLAALRLATGEARYQTEAERAWGFLEMIRDSRHDGFFLGFPTVLEEPREQNHHMHLFEACLGAMPMDSTGGTGQPAAYSLWRQRADALYSLFMSRVLSPEGFVVEYFQPDWSRHEALCDKLEPGHHFEWTWLLWQYVRATGQTVEAIARVYANGLRGVDADGLGVDEMNAAGELVRPTRRLWVECEALKGHLARFEATGEALYMDRARVVLDAMFARYLLPETGIWYDQLDAAGANISTYAPASTLYHLFIALDEFLRVTGP